MTPFGTLIKILETLICNVIFSRRKAWLDALELTETYKKTLVVCSEHFGDDAFNNPDDRKNSLLKPSACPSLCFPIKAIKRRSFDDVDLDATPSKQPKLSQVNVGTQTAFYAIDIETKLSKLQVELKELKMKLKENMRHKSSKTVGTQTGDDDQAGKRKRWKPADKVKALGMYHKSSVAYKYQRRCHRLPHPNTLLANVRKFFKKVDPRHHKKNLFYLILNVLEWGLSLDFVGLVP